jgi:hypothetical protein
MISFTTWLRQIGRTCRFLAEERKVKEAWVHGDTSATSIVSFDELYEQVFDDLDSDVFKEELEKYLPHDPATKLALVSFLDALKRVDSAVTMKPELKEATALLNSVEWQEVKAAAQKCLHLHVVKQTMDQG